MMYPTVPCPPLCQPLPPWMDNPVSEDKSETVTNVLLINYLYLLGDIENKEKRKSGTERVLFRLLSFSFI